MGSFAPIVTGEQIALLNKLLYQELTTGETTSGLRNQGSNSLQIASQQMRLSYFKAMRTFTATTLASTSLATAATGATFASMALYGVASDGTLTLLGACNNDVSFWTASNTRYSAAMTAPVSIVTGQIYAFGLLIVTAGTVPTILCSDQSAAGALGPLLASAPRLGAFVSGISGFPSTIGVGSLSQSGAFMIAEVLP